MMDIGTPRGALPRTGTMAWYNVKYETKEAAEHFARLAIGDAKQAAIEVIAAWNIQKVN